MFYLTYMPTLTMACTQRAIGRHRILISTAWGAKETMHEYGGSLKRGYGLLPDSHTPTPRHKPLSQVQKSAGTHTHTHRRQRHTPPLSGRDAEHVDACVVNHIRSPGILVEEDHMEKATFAYMPRLAGLGDHWHSGRYSICTRYASPRTGPKSSAIE